MAEPKNIQRLAEVEYCIGQYFATRFVPIMEREKDNLQTLQVQEVKDYSKTFASVLRTMANDMHGLPDDSMQHLQRTGRECSKTAEDYMGLCKEHILKDRGHVEDLARLAEEWRKAIVAETGRERYDDISSRLGTDLALAYVDYRIEQLMTDRMAAWQMPKSSFEYILRKGVSYSLPGLPQEVLKTPLQREIDLRGETAYQPSSTEKNAARVVGIATDAVTTGGLYSWGALARFAGAEILFSGMEAYTEKEQPKNGLTVEECISQAVFETTENIFPSIQKRSTDIRPYENDFIQSVNREMCHSMPSLTEKSFWERDNFRQQPFHNYQAQPFGNLDSTSLQTRDGEKDGHSVRVPPVVAPGYEEEYLAMNAETSTETGKQEQQTNTENKGHTGQGQEGNVGGLPTDMPSGRKEENDEGWDKLLESFGLDGIGDIGRNLPYVIAMLPDMLTGLLTGRTTSVNLRNGMIPVASILLGMFVRNPMLKLVLIGLGGANLMNKMGHEALDRSNGVPTNVGKYKEYADEALNPRISNPVLQGNTLIADIDHVPCTVTIPVHAAEACSVGALPLNTLANAVLARHDQMKQMAEDNYRSVEIQAGIQAERGIALR